MTFSKQIYTHFVRRGTFYTGTRNRMPLYPALQALFYRPGMSDSEFFLRGKRVNIILAIVLTFLTFLLTKTRIGLHAALNILLMTSLGIWIYVAGYVQAEIAYYFAAFATFVLMCLCLKRPTIALMLATGLMTAVSFLTKASILPSIPLFAACFLAQGLRYRGKPRMLLRHVFLLAVYFLACATWAGRYLIESKATFGSYLYNVNSVYFWCDSWQEAKAFSQAYDDRRKAPPAGDPAVPSFTKYFSEHTLGDAADRILDGMNKIRRELMSHSGVTKYLLTYTLASLAIIWAAGGGVIRRLRLLWPMTVFAVGYFIGYLILYAWYERVIPSPRFIYSLFLPFFFILAVAMRRVRWRAPLHFRGMDIPPAAAVNWLITVICLFDAELILYHLSSFP
jgi:hypothetical protein